MLKKYIKLFSQLSLGELVAQADEIRKKHIGQRLDLCAILNAKSGLCREDCKFCAQASRHKTGIDIYPLKNAEEIFKAVKRAQAIGAKRFGIVTSGNRLNTFELKEIEKAIRLIKKNLKVKICASFGELSKKELSFLKKAGLSRYHHNIETSPRYFKEIVRAHSFQDRLRTVKNAKLAGLEVCSGGIIGMGENESDRIEMALQLKKLGVDSVPVNILVPIKGTPLENIKPITPQEAIRALAIFRIILKNKTVKIAAGRETCLKNFQKAGFMAGANGMIIGGYLTIKGDCLASDKKLIKEIKKSWKK